MPGPTPREVLELPIFGTVCLLSSSFFIYLAEHAISHGRMGAFKLWWAVTFVLGVIFLIGTGLEWDKLITQDHLTIATNLFGTTYLLAGGAACVACGDRADDATDHADICADRKTERYGIVSA